MSRAREMIFKTMKSYRNDGRLDVSELDQIVEIAMEDGELDDDERQVLKNIIANLTSVDLSQPLWIRVEELISKFKLDQ